jgi:hypothetical protein
VEQPSEEHSTRLAVCSRDWQSEMDEGRDMKSDDGNTGDAPGAAPYPPAANDIEDEVTDAIERSYASRLTTGTYRLMN